MKNLPTDLLRAFVTVVELGGFTPAADWLGRSQPAVSLQIKRLEQLVGQTLLIRSGQQLELSRAGQQLFRYARQILALNDEAVAQFSKTAVSGKIHFGIPSEFATTLLPKIVGRFAQAYPNVTLEVTCALSKQLLSETERRRYDLILALHDDPAMAGHNLVKEDELVWVTGADHDAHLQSPLPLIAAPEGCIYRKRGIQRLQESLRDWRIVYTIPDLTGIQAAIEEGLGVTVLARSTVPENLRVLKPTEKLPRLGRVGISLIEQSPEPGEAIARLMDFVKASL
ncbi:LysR substrate-binding domain-containing protein [Porticoccus litoralis]|uniref:LysR substrate-binding domain-containing protein n=1 Tax=Porticoccus litoralis TaxID=434086 RepID=A0AAW8B749_9GAMM|nr:LysR substrate-binding domain-containing protein [Porticoccus litoralis]MDP1521437.1 LysR substrate-binding domain-containing protein [Porticoccus litoralis]TNE87626.1 MAG: LysR family transcriptional regulator [Gammaproteobacteria bacterium]